MREALLKFNVQRYYFPKWSAWLFAVLFVAMSLVYGYQEILFKPPQSVHRWRQTDCLSLTMNHYQGNPFLEPSVHNLCSDGTGRTVSDFPIIYYSVGQLWKVFGHHEFIYRGLVLLLFFLGLFALFRLSEKLLEDSLLGMLIPLFLFTSPTLVYYANNFLMDIPAFSFGLMGLYCFFRFHRSGRNVHLYLFAACYALAGLLKTPALMGFFAVCGIFGLELIGVRFKTEGRIFNRPSLQVIPLLLVLVIQTVWYLYAHAYNAANCAGIFLIGILPIWELTRPEIIDHLDHIREHIKLDYFRTETHVALALMFLLILSRWRKMDRTLLALTLIVSVEFVTFCVLFFQPLRDHDYYTINLFVLAPIIVLTAAMFLRSEWPAVYRSPIFRVLLIAFLIHNVDFTRRRMNDRYHPTGQANREYTEHLSSFKRIGPYLTQLGIAKEDRVICLSDPSINISLYMMERKGWTDYNLKSDSTRIEDRKRLGAKYLFIYDDEALKKEDLRPFFQRKIGQFESISIYEL